ncbi:hypothetical protein [Methylophaga pinxianii]|uniref:hypothetical protein n=1 Tax=Methylophaga pinxianii TaxID=2881052 RepID=UPI001CF2D158|nr:hypothetical protein [Methylophaga pinxianii]MCB2427108.1 hypothetical protein [Methylophaga pinxianii]UPH45994.1 hypothetical protein LGT42_001560 [Methylophaga pinxianii]
MKAQIFAISSLFVSGFVAAEHDNYQQCIFDESLKADLQATGQAITSYCTVRFFDTAPTAFQALVLLDNLEEMKQRDPKFKAFYDTVRKSGSNDIYTDRQIVLMYIDKREVQKD